MKTSKKGKLGTMNIKLDIHKAYIMVEWKFLCRMIEKLGFIHK